jgi:short-subunit dehydrogenase
LDVPVDEYRAMMEVNYLGAVQMTMKVIPVMMKQGGGRIINIASVAGLTGIPNLSGYVASKYALIGFSESVHMEFAPRIRVGVLCPGPVDTPFFGEQNPRDLFPGLVYRHMLDARTVAKEAMKLMDRPRFRVIPAGIRWAFRFRGWFPALSRKVTGMLYRPLLNKGGIRSQV